MRNQSIGTNKRWRDGDLTFTEVVSQVYGDCTFSAGYVDGHEVDNMYIKMERQGNIDMLMLLRPDEAAAIAWVATGILWSWERAVQEAM